MNAQRERFWTHRLRWRFKGAWQWPAFAAATVADALVLHLVPPAFLTGDLVWAFFMAMFGNLVIVGAVSPWLARRLQERDDSRPYVVTLDRVAVIALAFGVAGCLVFGIAKPADAPVTDRVDRANKLLEQEAAHSGDAELQRHVKSTNAIELGDGFFRYCVPRDDPRQAFCFYVDVTRKPPTIRRDSNPAPNGTAYPGRR